MGGDIVGCVCFRIAGVGGPAETGGALGLGDEEDGGGDVASEGDGDLQEDDQD
jgi:hypothetical protein